MFSPDYESYPWKEQKYVGFFTNHTNLFFEPFLETTYDEVINDSRGSFYIGKENKLYLYVNAGGEPTNLDNLPSCTIDGIEYPVTQATKGVYYITVKLTGVQPDTILTDIWSNIVINGEELDDVEMEFVCLSRNNFLNIGSKVVNKEEPESLEGEEKIEDEEEIIEEEPKTKEKKK